MGLVGRADLSASAARPILQQVQDERIFGAAIPIRPSFNAVQDERMGGGAAIPFPLILNSVEGGAEKGWLAAVLPPLLFPDYRVG